MLAIKFRVALIKRVLATIHRMLLLEQICTEKLQQAVACMQSRCKKFDRVIARSSTRGNNYSISKLLTYISHCDLLSPSRESTHTAYRY